MAKRYFLDKPRGFAIGMGSSLRPREDNLHSNTDSIPDCGKTLPEGGEGVP
jgi:hypothetical protein